MGFGQPMHIFGANGGSFFANMWGKPGSILELRRRAADQAVIP